MRAAALALALCACTAEPRAWAGRIESPAQLVGGPRALGEIGDYRLSNGRVRFVIQGIDRPSRAFGAFGGSVIDADLERGVATGDQRTLQGGKDGLGEIFPAFFLQGIEPAKLEVISDGAGGGRAHLRVTGKQGEFYTATRFADTTLLGDGLAFSIDYELGPQDDFLTMTATLHNTSATEHAFPITVAPVPVGFICLFGEGQPVFLPGEAGYDARFTLEKIYARGYRLPALPGVATSLVAVDGPEISYGLSYCPSCASPYDNATGPSGFVYNHRDIFGAYGPVDETSLLVPMVSSTLFAVYAGEPPGRLAAGKAFSTTMRLRVGPPGVSRQTDALFQESGDDGAGFSGVVREQGSELPVGGATVVVLGDGDAVVTSVRSDPEGRIRALLPVGSYRAVVRKDGHAVSAPVGFRVKAREMTWLEPHLPRSAVLAVEVIDEQQRLIPAKVSLDASYSADHAGEEPRTFLYDLRVGDRYRPADLTPDTADPETRRYLEVALRAPLGRVQGEVRPGKYRLTVSRGPDYSLFQQDVELVAGLATHVVARIARVVPAAGRISADLHVHAAGSVDSDVPLEERAASYAAEGIDYIALTEHNFVSDARPAIERMGLSDFLQASTGLEVSSLEGGHWNAYPLRREAATATHGSPDWFRTRPAKLFDALRASGEYGPDETIVQVNHPRDPAQGYFMTYGVTGDALTGDAKHDWPGRTGLMAPSGPEFGAGLFSPDFDAIEVFTGKRADLLRTYRVPSPPPPAPVPVACDKTVPPNQPGCMGPPGSIVRGADGLVAFPGALDDWAHFLDAGKRYTAVANSDSHVLLDEGGWPRNSIDLGHPIAGAREIDEREVVRAIKAGRVVASMGIDLQVSAVVQGVEKPLGSLVQPGPDGYVRLHVRVSAPSWIDVQRLTLLSSQGPCDERVVDCRAVSIPLEAVAPGTVVRFDKTITVGFGGAKDGWVAVEAEGDRSLWPVVIPLEVPPLLISDAVARLATTFGIVDPFGNLKPKIVTQVKPWALTNPVFVDGDRDGRWTGALAPASTARVSDPEAEFARWR